MRVQERLKATGDASSLMFEMRPRAICLESERIG
jgi:hypothetical protein